MSKIHLIDSTWKIISSRKLTPGELCEIKNITVEDHATYGKEAVFKSTDEYTYYIPLAYNIKDRINAGTNLDKNKITILEVLNPDPNDTLKTTYVIDHPIN